MRSLLSKLLVVATLALTAATQAAELTPQQRAFRAIYQELVDINTTDSVGDTAKAAEAMVARLKAGGIPAAEVHVFATAPRKGNVVARLRGTGAHKPILLLAHLDVVEAKREDWASDPFKLQEVDGQFRGRGVIDDKAMAAIFVANLIEFAKEGFRPERDIIVALTTDEELSDSPHNGVRFLLQNHRNLIDAEFAINEGGGAALRNGQPFRIGVQLAEKIYQSFVLEVTDPGGHSASGRRDNAIYRLAGALQRLSQFDFPPHLNAVTRGYFERLANVESGATIDAIKALLAGNADPTALAPLTNRPDYNAQMRTTCVPTVLAAGDADNALPQSARATVNCRIVPDEAVADVESALKRVINDDQVTLIRKGVAVLSSPSSINPEVLQTVARLTAEMWPGITLSTTMSAGYTDNRWLRNAGIPAYGTSGLFSDPGRNGVHGRNERVGVKAVYDSKEFLYRLVKQLAAPGQAGQK